MISQRFSLFYAGFTAYTPAFYFGGVAFANDYKGDESQEVCKHMLGLLNDLSDKESESTTHLKTAISIADHFKLKTLPQPLNAKDYFDWLGHYIETVENQFPMARIDHYYFLFSRKIAEILCNTGLMKLYADACLKLGEQIDLKRKIEKCLKDNEYILFKLMAASALLSTEPRQNYFNVFYRSLMQEFEPFKGINLDELNTKELEKLISDLSGFETLTMDGFKKCIGMLKELGI
jgi:hypothetical protein